MTRFQRCRNKKVIVHLQLLDFCRFPVTSETSGLLLLCKPQAELLVACFCVEVHAGIIRRSEVVLIVWGPDGLDGHDVRVCAEVGFSKLQAGV